MTVVPTLTVNVGPGEVMLLCVFPKPYADELTSTAKTVMVTLPAEGDPDGDRDDVGEGEGPRLMH